MENASLVLRLRRRFSQSGLALLCVVLLVPGNAMSVPQEQQPAGSSQQAQTRISPDQLDSIVAPIALYPDALLGQILVASTYPLEIVQLDQWMQKNSKMPKEKLADEVKKENWDPSVQGLVVVPDVVKNLSENIKWTTELGDAFLAQQNDVMDAVQKMRAKAKQTGNLKSTEQQKVETKVVENKEIIIIQPAKTEVVYVPSYNPTVVYGPPVYPYPPYPYPPPPPPGTYAAGMAVSFGVGMMVGAAWSGGYGYNCRWGGNNTVNVNVNNNYIKNYNAQNVNNRVGSGNANNWQHNSQHRGGAPYPNKATAQKYGGSARSGSMSSRQANARENQAQAGNRGQTGTRSNPGQLGGQQPRASNRSASPSANTSSRGGGLGGSSTGTNGSAARASSSRGSSSMSSRGGGGGRRR
jgi:hypothetical protein